MKRLELDLSSGLNLTRSEGSLPFKITNLPFIPRPGLNWDRHPGFDVINLPEDLSGVSKVDYADLSGLLVFRKDGTTYIANPSLGIYKTTPLAPDGGAFITRLGLYNGRHSGQFAFLEDVGDPVTLMVPEVVSGSLDSGLYHLWALSFSKTPSGLFLRWYSHATVTIPANSGIRIKLDQEPGPNRVAQLYIQRQLAGGLSKMTFLASLTGDEKTFDYLSHLQEGEAVDLAIPKGTGGRGLYWGGRHFYPSTELAVLGAKGAQTTGSGGGQQPPQVDAGYGYVYGIERGFGSVAVNSPPVTTGPTSPWHTAVRTDVGTFVAVSKGTKIVIMLSKDPYLMGWSTVAEFDGITPPQASAASPNVVVFLGDGYAIRGLLQDPYNLANWSKYTTPGSSIGGVVWSGNQFGASVNAPAKGIMLSSDGANWTLQSSTANEQQLYDFGDIIFLGGQFIIQGRKPLADGFFVDYFSYASGTWNRFHREEWFKYSLGDAKAQGVVRRRYSFMTTFTDGGQTYVIVSYGIKGGLYWFGFLSWVDLPESDYHAVYTASAFLSDGKPEAVEYAPPTANNNAPYPKKAVLGAYPAFLFRYGNNDILYAYSKTTAPSGQFSFGNRWGRVTGLYAPSADGANGPQGSLYLLTALGITFRANGSSPAYYSFNSLRVSPFMVNEKLFYMYEGRLYKTEPNLTTESYVLPPYAAMRLLAISAGYGKIAIAQLADTPFGHGIRVLLSDASSPDSWQTLWTRNGPESALLFGALRVFVGPDGVYVLLYGQWPNPASAIKIDFAGQATQYNLSVHPSQGLLFATDETNTYLAVNDTIYKLEATAIPVHTASGQITGMASGPGKVYYGVGTNVYELDTATNTATQIFTLQDASLRWGWENNGVLRFAASNGFYLWDGTSVNTVHQQNGAFYSVPQGGASQGSSNPTEGAAASTVKFPANTVVWTLPGYINLTTPHYWYTFTSRTSRSINEMVGHPSGVLVFMDNETFVMNGRFTSVNDTRVAPYPVPIGADRGTRVAQAGATLFVIWGGKVYTMDNDVFLVSYPVDDGIRFVGVAYDPKESTLLALKEDGRVLGYNPIRKVWYNEANDVSDIAQYYDGINSIVALLRGGRFYSRFTGGAPSPHYYAPEPVLVLEAVRMGNEDIKRLRGVLLEANVEGPVSPIVSFYTESGTLTYSAQADETLASGPFGLVRYRLFMPPIIFRSLNKMAIRFSGYRFSLGDKIEVRYEGVSRRA